MSLKSELQDSQDWLDDLELRIGFLRQWLNEDRITDGKLVTNEEIKHWLGYDKQAIKAHIKQEMLAFVGEMEARETEDMSLQSWGKEDYKAFGRNELRAELRKAINDKYKED